MQTKKFRKVISILVAAGIAAAMYAPSFARGSTDFDESSYRNYFSNEHGLGLGDNFGDIVPFSEKVRLGIPNEAVAIIGNEDVEFYVVDKTIYRLYEPTGEIDTIFEDDNLASYRPITSEKFLFSIGEVIPEEVGIISEMNYDMNTNYYVCDTVTNEINLAECDEVSLYLALSTVNFLSVNTFTTTINGKDIPLSGYKPGDSTTGLDSSTSSGCAAFAYYAYKQIWGYAHTLPSDTSSKVALTESNAKDKLSTANLGAIIKFDAKTTGGGTTTHFVILVAKDADSMTFYHSNYSSYNTVSFDKFTWAELASAFPNFYYKINSK